MKIAWDEAKRRVNLRKHGLDFADAEDVFAGVTFTIEDRRFEYGEQRFITFGVLRDTVVMMAHTETSREVRIISMRKATRHEQIFFFESIQAGGFENRLAASQGDARLGYRLVGHS